jgi:thiol:disulfide interchange protein
MTDDGRRRALIALGLFALAPLAPASAQALPEKFDPARDAAKDLAAALALAKAAGKRVIVDVGGEWCIWCHVLDRFFASHADLDALRSARYVWLKVNFSKENENRAFLARWPAIAGYPHLFVLDANGRLVHSQDTSELEQGKGYDPAKMRAFLERWAGGSGTAT